MEAEPDPNSSESKFIRTDTAEFQLDFGEKDYVEEQNWDKEAGKALSGIKNHREPLYLMKPSQENDNDATLVKVDFINPKPEEILRALKQDLYILH